MPHEEEAEGPKINRALRAFVSCSLLDYRENETLKAVCDFLLNEGFTISSIPPYRPFGGYEEREALIEQCDVFIAVMEEIIAGPCKRLTDFNYACNLQRVRWSPRPRIFKLWLGPEKEDAFMRENDGIALERLDRSNLKVLFLNDQMEFLARRQMEKARQ